MADSAPAAPIIPARTLTRRGDYRPSAYRVTGVYLVFDLESAATTVHARLGIERVGEEMEPLVLHAEGLEISDVRVNGQALRPGVDYVQDLKTLTLHGMPAQATVETSTHLVPRDNTALMGLYESGGVLCTQCEAEAFRRITPYLDRPDVLAPFTVTLRADKARFPVLLSNGNKVSSRDLDDGRHEVVWQDPWPKPSYLFALVAGDLVCTQDRFVTQDGRVVDLGIYTKAHEADRTGHAMTALKDSMAWDERVYGCAYDLDVFNIVAIPDFNMGAMENKGLNIFNSKYVLAKPEVATDAEFETIAAVVAHEYFHNWSGNRVTCRDWFQLSLKEGFTVFRDQQFSADHASPAIARIGQVRRLRSTQFPEDAGPLAHPVRPESYVEIDNFYTATVYEKGAEVVRMLHTLAGPEGFRRATDLYFSRHDGQAATVEDFLACVADATGLDLGQFARWYDQAGTPVVTARATWEPAAGSGSGTWTLTLTQRTPPTPGQTAKQPLVIPVRLGLLDASGQEMALTLEGEAIDPDRTTRVLLLTDPQQRFVFTGLPAEPVASLGRGFSAPVIWDTGLTADQRRHLLAHDQDAVTRWDAAQELMTAEILDLYAAPGQPVDAALIRAVGAVLDDESADPALVAEILEPPLVGVLAQRLETVDFPALHAARQTLRRALALSLQVPLMAHHRRLASAAHAGVTPQAMAQRRLRSACLGLLSEIREDAVATLARTQYFDAPCMTERLSALRALVRQGGPAASAALEDFQQRFAEDAQAMDHWFAVQAAAERDDAPEVARTLTHHPAFTLRTPNRVRAVVGPFTANAPGFHRADGAGYALIGDLILALEPLNPSVAAGLVTAFRIRPKLDGDRRGMVDEQLSRILAKPGLSDMVHERAQRILTA